MNINQPEHVAIIMDGNGRWAQKRSHRRVWGHIRGSFVVSKIIRKASDLKLKSLTLYSFSTENWGRPSSEVNTLLKLLKKFLIRERNRVIKHRIRFKVMGDYSSLPQVTKDLIAELETLTKDYDGLKLTIAFGYGGRTELLGAVNKWIEKNPGRNMQVKDLEENLMVPDLGDVDLLIRTGGDHRISNFLLWQIAYAELVFTDTPWPDFTTKEFEKIVDNFRTIERRFGMVNHQKSLKDSVKIAEKNKKLFFNRETQR
jgi:undecaprenyl diphosphate synthase